MKIVKYIWKNNPNQLKYLKDSEEFWSQIIHKNEEESYFVIIHNCDFFITKLPSQCISVTQPMIIIHIIIIITYTDYIDLYIFLLIDMIYLCYSKNWWSFCIISYIKHKSKQQNRLNDGVSLNNLFQLFE